MSGFFVFTFGVIAAALVILSPRPRTGRVAEWRIDLLSNALDRALKAQEEGE